jgi:hypothetical protein
MGGVYISPYTALVGPAGQSVPTITGVPTQVICDDFTTEVSINTAPWQATVTNLGTLQGEPSATTALKFDHSSAIDQMRDYTTAAYLAIEILQAQQQGDTSKQGELSFALWGLFDPTFFDSLGNIVGGDPTGPFSGHWITGTALSAANGYLSAAQTAVTTLGLNPSQYSNVDIYTPSPSSASQEYITVQTPEPTAAALLAVDLFGLGGLILLLRRRPSRAHDRRQSRL